MRFYCFLLLFWFVGVSFFLNCECQSFKMRIIHGHIVKIENRAYLGGIFHGTLLLIKNFMK